MNFMAQQTTIIVIDYASHKWIGLENGFENKNIKIANFSFINDFLKYQVKF
jgi:hypothetical protein